MSLSAGTRLGPYEILSSLGAGGMGEVYRAKDTRLDRFVAVKVCREQVSDRFAREARTVAALNHPNIVALFDVGQDYFVTELVDGDSLRNAHLTPRRAIEIAIQIADGLAAAHAVGIAHRDIKPDNVMLTRDGRAKILDFGLSRHEKPDEPTDTTRTLPGTVMGTLGYMSPEQVRGQEADHRSDIFSFGATLYEMLAGRRAFTGDTAPEVMSEILKRDPPELPAGVPAQWRELIRHCLEKGPSARFQSAKDLSFALRSLLVASDSTGGHQPLPAAKPNRTWLFYGLAAAGILAAAAIAWFAKPKDPIDLTNYRFTPFASESSPETDPVWSPDGKTIAYAARAGRFNQVFTRRLDSPIPDQVTRDDRASRPLFWSASGDRIYFIQRGRELWSIAAIGGASRKELDDVREAALAPDGVTLALARLSELAFGKLGDADWKPFKVAPFDGNFGTAKLQFSPDGSKLAVLYAPVNSTAIGELWLLPNPPGKWPPKRFPLDRNTAQIAGFSWMPDSRDMVLAIADNASVQLYLADSQGRKLRKLSAGLDRRDSPAVSPDGRRIAFVSESNDSDLVEIPLDGSEFRPLLNTARSESAAAWLPTGREFVYLTTASGAPEIWVRNPDDNRSRPLISRANDALPDRRINDVSVSPDADRFAIGVAGTEHTVWLLRPTGGKAVRLDPANPDHHNAAWSPDGNWIAYGRVRPKQQLMKAPAGGGAPVVVAELDFQAGPAKVAWSPAGDWIAWTAQSLTLYSPDGKQSKKLANLRNEIAFSKDGKTLYAMRFEPPERRWFIEGFDVATGNVRQIGNFQLDRNATISGFRLHPDGKRFLTTLTRSNPDIVLLEGF